MTEIPEHLLKRSKERRSAIGGGDSPAEEGAPAGEVEAAPAAAPVAPVAAAAAVPEPAPVPEPVRPEVAAALSRRKIPYWAIPVLAALPLWAYVYQATLEPAPTGELTPLEAGRAVYVSAACQGCHQANGGGQRQRPRVRRRAGDLAGLPRPHDVGAARQRGVARAVGRAGLRRQRHADQQRHHARAPSALRSGAGGGRALRTSRSSAAWRSPARSTSSCSPSPKGI